MTAIADQRRSGCPISFGLDIFGDRWTLLILRDLLLKKKNRFREFLASEELIASNILADRLARLERAGLIARLYDKDDGRQIIYQATKAGAGLLPVLVELAYWGATHDVKSAAPPEFAKAYRTNRSGLIRRMTQHGKPR